MPRNGLSTMFCKFKLGPIKSEKGRNVLDVILSIQRTSIQTIFKKLLFPITFIIQMRKLDFRRVR